MSSAGTLLKIVVLIPTLPLNVPTPETFTLFPNVAAPDTSRVPFASIFPPNVLIPAVTFIPPFVTLHPCPAVIIPIESTFVTSSYVRVPAMLTLPPNVVIPVTFN